MASAEPSTTPNPDAMKFTLDTTLPEMLNITSMDEAEGHPFAAAMFATGEVTSVFGVNDFVTITRTPGADWDALIEQVKAAAAQHL